MKTAGPFLILIIMISALGCDKATVTPDVEEYIKLLKSNQYTALNLPPFNSSDIPALLKYRSDTSTIKVFPRNFISSAFVPNCKLGVYVLWTIESIRAVSISSKYLVRNFPSQNSMLQDRTTLKWEQDYKSKAYDIAAQAYFDWWENNKQKDYNDFKNIDPLGQTSYAWH